MKPVADGLVCFVTVSKRIRIEFAGIVLAESYRSGHRFRAYRVIETAGSPVYYLPQDDIQMAYLEPSQQTALCEWKGISRYWSVRVADRLVQNVAWSYPALWEGQGNKQNDPAGQKHLVTLLPCPLPQPVCWPSTIGLASFTESANNLIAKG